jgi:hypothetical protein
MNIEDLSLRYRVRHYWHQFGIPKYYNTKNVMYNMFYQIWINFGSHTGFVRKYNIKRQKSLETARQALEEAFTPQLKSMLKENLKDEK